MKKQIVHTEKAPQAIGPYSQGVKYNGFIYTSGQIPFNVEKNELVTTGIQDEVHQVMKNVIAILEAGGTTIDQVVKTTIFVKDLNDFNAVNEVYASYFNDENYPARECVEVARLPRDVNVEISVIAIAD
ncbi:RidA family protein [Empedobacter falsenii]|jgi:2-iminobutanoate/2-iminopropanoate deaminase|uniref:RidA family protein n=1 Tax=Empedobacter falsenii TaxID=343874 RepID=A0A3R8TS35_9FLAO|nr:MULTISPECIES: RidA family protein [Empedobacter]HAR73711.1 reactive intermediate/imine deaminase [Flavobacteriaceae bacterium]MBW1617174.1 RidA family protein [Empedobacter falsenii]MDH0658443.1 RidA family protein [Empedobacter sp. GD03865]MDH0673750.1 RidA family protein [Empedobacter sp. GD03861]MDH1602034.1 RidA family protein [Empedobacter sp. GD03739]